MSYHFIIFYDGFHITGVVKSMKIIKSPMNGSIRNLSTNRRTFEFSPGIFLGTFGVQIFKIKVPFSNNCGVITILFQKTRNSWTVFNNQTGSKALNNSG